MSKYSRKRAITWTGAAALTLACAVGFAANASATTRPYSIAPAVMFHKAATSTLSSSSDAPWVARYTVGTTPITDSNGNVWTPTTGIVGGTLLTNGEIGNTGSPQLYKPYVHGMTSWTVALPATGAYAIDMLVSAAPANKPNEKFNVNLVAGSTRTTLATNVTPVVVPTKTYPLHVTASFTSNYTPVRLEMNPTVGVADIAGLKITQYQSTDLSGPAVNDTFDGAAGTRPSSVWTTSTQPGWEGSSGVEAYTSSTDNSSLNGQGQLAMKAIRQNTTVGGKTYSWTSSRYTTLGSFGLGYGHMQVTAKSPAAMSGVVSAFWAKGVNEPTVGWPSCGEIDTMENLGKDPGQVAGNVHLLGNANDPIGSGGQHIGSIGRNWHPGIDTTANYHTYGVDYRPDSVTFTLDGQAYRVIAREDLNSGQQWPFDGSKFYLILSLQVQNSNWTGNVPDVPVGTTETMLVDSVVAQPGAPMVSYGG